MFVGLKYQRKFTFRSDEAVALGRIFLTGNVLDRNTPLVGDDAARFQEAKFFLRRIRAFPRRFVGTVRYHPVDGINAEMVEEPPAVRATQVFLQEIIHDVMSGDR